MHPPLFRCLTVVQLIRYIHQYSLFISLTFIQHFYTQEMIAIVCSGSMKKVKNAPGQLVRYALLQFVYLNRSGLSDDSSIVIIH